MVNIPIDKKLYYRVKNQAKKNLIHGKVSSNVFDSIKDKSSII